MAKLNGRKIVDIELEGIDTRDYPDFCDAFISAAAYADTGESLNDEELDELNENGSLVYDLVIAHLF
jgi:hypothetical protein